mgnify:CR=1 FL=1
MTSLDSKLYQFAVKEAKEAVAMDGQGEYRKAINKYERAAESLLKFVKFNDNKTLNKKCKKQIEQYINRAKVLKSHLGGGPAGKASGAKKGGDFKGDGEKVPEEEQKLIDAISSTIISESPDITWDDIAGLEKSKQILREAIVLPILKPDLFVGARRPWSGVLLFGPPGCGKTLLAKAAASECEATFFYVSSADLLSKWLGESEKLVSSLFKVSRLRAPSLIFIDEIDSVATKRGGGGESGGERRIKTQLLTEIQGIKTDAKKTLLVLGATNRPWDIDNAMLSRFQKKVYIPLPDLEARAKIFELETKGVNMDLDQEDFIELGVRSEGYSGRDIANVCREVVMIPIRELDATGILDDPSEQVEVRDLTIDDFKKTLKEVKPMTDDALLQKFEKWAKKFGELS